MHAPLTRMIEDLAARLPGAVERAAKSFAGAPWRQLPEAALDPTRGVPSMLSAEERRLYLWLGESFARGRGAVLDLGCFAGGSTACLAEGLRRGGHGGPVLAFDFFTAGEAQKRRIIYPAGIEPFEGEDIFPLARRLLAPWEGMVTFHRGDVFDFDWTPRPIEILVCDIFKMPALADRAANRFYRDLIPGRSVLVQQDYQAYGHPWVACQMELLADCFRPVAVCAEGTVAFLTLRRPRREDLAAARTRRLDDAAMLALLERARRRFAGTTVAEALARSAEGIRVNPGCRKAWDYRQP